MSDNVCVFLQITAHFGSPECKLKQTFPIFGIGFQVLRIAKFASGKLEQINIGHGGHISLGKREEFQVFPHIVAQSVDINGGALNAGS